MGSSPVLIGNDHGCTLNRAEVLCSNSQIYATSCFTATTARKARHIKASGSFYSSSDALAGMPCSAGGLFRPLGKTHQCTIAIAS